MKRIESITREDIVYIAEGAAFLGTGGGGDPYLGRLLVEQTIEQYGPPKVISPDELEDDWHVFTSGMMGAPSVMIEKFIGVEEADLAVRALEQYLGVTADAILPAEMGGMNSMFPLAVAAFRRIPVIDADSMGRAFPELQMCTFNVFGVNASPMSMANEHGEVILYDVKNSARTEQFARQQIIQFGGSAAISCYPMSGATARRVCVPHTLSLAFGIGKALHEGRCGGDPLPALLDYLRTTEYYGDCGILLEGKITDIERVIRDGWTIGTCRIEGFSSDSQLELTFQNENLLAKLDGRVAAIVPDLICVADVETGAPITTEHLKYGQRVAVIATSAAPVMRTSEALGVFGPACFGLEEEYVPVGVCLKKVGYGDSLGESRQL
uniref:DUF917 domain-containing protein n=1 Tax=Candidatus Kentrum sp. SD TaxID=2126332 RepID=A0A450YSD3_9GAMM|nr:MAG: hypothetical protein BECKSD772F_GA0070984_11803 [Candidatus Kentron sp. SD]VFK49464.1 MAG: hypothetical protein BECKSD772E_GA0070983_11813 [Candidatus Kentron sp. SD]VFK80590.1 MAG: hypothetical protein BECKSD772D_GA0070982_11313 [Candidatus Kentron sp. SD]